MRISLATRRKLHASRSPGATAAALTAATALVAARPAVVQDADAVHGVWLIDEKAAVQIFDCDGLMCGRIIWLQTPRDAQGQADRDVHNPDLALRDRPLCGQTILWNLHPVGPRRWRDGWFYNPHDGKTYRVSAQLRSDDVLVARIYEGLPLFGKTETLTRIAQETSAGWC